MVLTERPEAFPAAVERKEKGRTVSRRATRYLAGKGPENLSLKVRECCHHHVLRLCGCLSAVASFSVLKPELALTLMFPLLQPVPHSVTFLLVPLPLLSLLPPMTVLEDRS
jgi:hypothetical protein